MQFDLENRRLLHQNTPGFFEHIKTPRKFYVGFDPTSDSLHVGSLAPINIMRMLIKNGHKVVALIGGATGMIGDPSGKSKERNFLDVNQLLHNESSIQKQLIKLVGEEVEVMNNLNWMHKISFLDFLRKVGKHSSVNQMMSRDSVKNRITRSSEEDSGFEGISFAEFSYQLIQSYDFYHLFENNECTVQFGGSDQWGNITAGIDLIRRIKGESQNVHAFTCPLIMKSDGKKFGKTEEGNVWLDPEKTSPFHFYQFWINQTDEDSKKWLFTFTDYDEDTLNMIIKDHDEMPSSRIAQNYLASSMTKWVHGPEGLNEAELATRTLFGKLDINELRDMSYGDFWKIFKNVPNHEIEKTKVFTEDIKTVLTDSGIFDSKGDVRKMIKSGGLKINNQKISYDSSLKDIIFLHDAFLVQKGKKNFHILKLI